MKNYIIFFFVLGIIACNSKDKARSGGSDQARSTVDSILHDFIPDSRVDIGEMAYRSKNGRDTIRVVSSSKEALDSIEDFLSDSHPRVVFESTLLPDESVGDKNFALVNISVANLRSKPDHSAQLVTQALLGTPLEVLQQDGGWCRVRTPDRYIAWLDKGGLALKDKVEMRMWKGVFRHFVHRLESTVRDTGRGNLVLSDLTYGNIVETVSVEEDSTVIKLPDGRMGYIPNADAISIDSIFAMDSLARGEMDSFAMQLMGRPYLWGGTSARALDCSGFTKTLLWSQGVVFPRDASQQVHAGVKIPYDAELSHAREGDLIFFGEKRNDGSDKITHVAYYLGDGKILHASGMVKIESLFPDSPLYNQMRAESALQIRRIIGEEEKLHYAKSSYHE